jgi:hypothetical protein
MKKYIKPVTEVICVTEETNILKNSPWGTDQLSKETDGIWNFEEEADASNYFWTETPSD